MNQKKNWEGGLKERGKKIESIISMVILSCKWKWIMRNVAMGHDTNV